MPIQLLCFPTRREGHRGSWEETVLRREVQVSAPPILMADYLVSRSRIGGSDAIERNIRRNVVSRHDFLHVGHVFGDIVLIVFARVFKPFGVVVVELALVID